MLLQEALGDGRQFICACRLINDLAVHPSDTLPHPDASPPTHPASSKRLSASKRLVTVKRVLIMISERVDRGALIKSARG